MLGTRAAPDAVTGADNWQSSELYPPENSARAVSKQGELAPLAGGGGLTPWLGVRHEQPGSSREQKQRAGDDEGEMEVARVND